MKEVKILVCRMKTVGTGGPIPGITVVFIDLFYFWTSTTFRGSSHPDFGTSSPHSGLCCRHLAVATYEWRTCLHITIYGCFRGIFVKPPPEALSGVLGPSFYYFCAEIIRASVQFFRLASCSCLQVYRMSAILLSAGGRLLLLLLSSSSVLCYLRVSPTADTKKQLFLISRIFSSNERAIILFFFFLPHLWNWVFFICFQDL